VHGDGMTDGERILHLEAENDRLRRMAEAAGIPPIVRADMPRPDELVRLHGMVTRQYPQLACEIGSFELSLLSIAYFRRGKKLNVSY
jgi:hypothetical protein